ncbi:Choline transporter-like protein [Kalmanozyma brasiliensis GHG001]|uniref:Choline transporter-like protein n=1 Tax=Kalmanozyma brasiliensis (strain GHG001) TaxID=1365824 RepID=UPI002867BD07|nr:Choline transporter-like protein [Kalmanozyma brasiliensis GHG001]EST09511.2 Choline transporter-like protein [Kalmanozyma brasiliensis GHG001]
MTSLSQYASRFLSSGLATPTRPGTGADQDVDDPGDPLFYSHASISGAPFSHPASRHHPYGPEYSLSSSDGLPTPPTNCRAGTQSGILHSLRGASRFGPSSFIASGRGRPTGGAAYSVHDSMIREIDDEDDVDLWQDDRHVPRSAALPAENVADSLGGSAHASASTQQRTAHLLNASAPSAAIAGQSSFRVPVTSRRAPANDTQDPFLAEGDFDDGASHHSLASTKDHRTSDEHSVQLERPAESSRSQTVAHHQRREAAKTRGWLAHGSVLDTATNSTRTPTRREPRYDPSSSSIYSHSGRRTDASQLGDSSIYAQPNRTNKARSKVSRPHQSRGEGLFSIYDEREEEDDEDRSDMSRSRSGSVSASSVTESEYDTEGESRRAQPSRRMSRNRARQMTSTLREPLLPSGSGNARPLKIAIRHNSDETEEEGDSDLDGHQRSRRSGGKPGARKREEDIIDEIHLYPAPPARAGWGPWANRLAFGKYRDKTAIASFAAAVCATVLIGAYLSWGARTPAQPKTPKTRPSSYYTITRSLPILILLTLLSFGAGVGNLLLLRNLNRFGGAKVLRTGLMGVPIVLGLGWAWAFAGSFIYDDEAWSGGGWSTTGLRVISIVPLALAVIFARMVWQRRKALSRSIAVLELSCNVVLQHPALLVLALASLGAFALITVPFLFLFTRLFLVGHFGRQVGDTMEWETDTKAAWLAWATLCAWLWTWAVLRGVQRVTVAGVVSHWYFHRIGDEAIDTDAQAGAGSSARVPSGTSAGGAGRPRSLDKRRADESQANNILFDGDSIYDEQPGAPGSYPQQSSNSSARRHAAPDPTEVVRVSFARATGPALGTICMSALILSIVKTLTVVAETARRISDAATQRRVPKFLQPLTHVVVLLAGLGAVLQGYSNLALVYVGVTGDGFWTAAKKSAQLVSRRGVQGVMEGLVVNLVLDLTAIALSFLAGLVGFLFSAHQLHVPADAPLVGLLCALLPYWTLRLCADVLSNASDTLYLCYAIDHASNDEHCPKAAEAFTAKSTAVSDSILPF